MVALAPPRLLGLDGLPFTLDPDVDAPLVGPPTLALVGTSPRSNACHAWRVWQPFGMLQAYGYPCEWGVNEDPRTVVHLPRFKAVVLCRLSWMQPQWAGARTWFDLAHKAGRRVLYECDDDLFSPFIVAQAKGGVSRDSFVEQLEAERLAALWTLRQCDGVTVTTQRLATVIRTFTDKPVEVVPNAIDVHWFRAVQALGRRTVPGLTIGWAGGSRPRGDVLPMAEAWGRIARRYPHVTFVVYGHQPAALWPHVPEPRIRRLPWRDVYDYPLELLNIDIACCPLEERHFNRAKSPIKAFEAGLSGSAVVASPTVYREVIRDEENGLLATTVDEWEAALARVLQDEEERRHLAGQPKGYPGKVVAGEELPEVAGGVAAADGGAVMDWDEVPPALRRDWRGVQRCPSTDRCRRAIANWGASGTYHRCHNGVPLPGERYCWMHGGAVAPRPPPLVPPELLLWLAYLNTRQAA